jgi:hypothetical protein
MGRETKSLDVMGDKSPPDGNEPIAPHDVSANVHDQSTITYESSTITHEGSTSTHEVSTTTHEDSTLNEQSTSYEHSITSQELGNLEIQAVDSSQSTPKQILEVEEENKNSLKIISQEQGTCVFTVQDDQTDEPNISDDVPSTFDVVLETSDDKPSTSSSVVTEKYHYESNTSDVPNNSEGEPGTSEDVPEISITAALSNNVQIEHASGNSEIVKTNGGNTEIDCKRHSSTDSEPFVVDSKI